MNRRKFLRLLPTLSVVVAIPSLWTMLAKPKTIHVRFVHDEVAFRFYHPRETVIACKESLRHRTLGVPPPLRLRPSPFVRL